MLRIKGEGVEEAHLVFLGYSARCIKIRFILLSYRYSVVFYVFVFYGVLVVFLFDLVWNIFSLV